MKTKASHVNQEEVITSSDSDFKRDTGSLKSRLVLFLNNIFDKNNKTILYHL